MSEEVLIPKMEKMDKSKRKIHIPWLNISVILLCTLLIIFSTFVNLNIKHYIIPHNLFTSNNLNSSDFIKSIHYIPQIPIIVFICAVLGKKMSLAGIMLYLVIGLFFAPVFALGGGWKYIGEYGFGYLLAYIPAVLLCGNILKEKYTLVNMLKASICAVLTIHFIGILYMILVSIIKQSGIDFITGWICVQSGVKILYDMFFSYILVIIGKYLHIGLKFVLE